MKKPEINQEYVLSGQVILKIKDDDRLKRTLALSLKVKVEEINDWIGANNPCNKLTNIGAVTAIQEHTGMPPKQILTLVPSYSRTTSTYTLPRGSKRNTAFIS